VISPPLPFISLETGIVRIPSLPCGNVEVLHLFGTASRYTVSVTVHSAKKKGLNTENLAALYV
jgi:hypothetical protein